MRSVVRKFWEWIFRGAALRAARAAAVDASAVRGRADRQARLLLEVARRVAEPVERLPPGARPAVLMSLYRDATYYALVAGRTDEGQWPSDLGALWVSHPPEALLRAAPDQANLDAIKRSLVGVTPSSALDATRADAARARAFVEALVAEQDGPRRKVGRVLLQRWSRLVLSVVSVLALVYGVQQLTLGPNLAAKKPFRSSSTWSGCTVDPGCQAQLFHTEHENNPWIEFDLLAPTTIQRIEVTNRTDCCAERAIPIVAEVSMDRTNWMQVGRRDSEFASWTVDFTPRTARYVKLRLVGVRTFHLKNVKIR
jgi:hypothetical protein